MTLEDELEDLRIAQSKDWITKGEYQDKEFEIMINWLVTNEFPLNRPEETVIQRHLHDDGTPYTQEELDEL